MKYLQFFLLSFLPAAAVAAPLLEKPSLVSSEWLAEHLSHPEVRVIDARPSLAPYLQGHIPGAVYLNTESVRISAGGVPARLLPAVEVAGIFGRLGIGNQDTVVIYSSADDNFAHAAYIAFLLEWLGHSSIGVLDGGMEKWRQEGRETTTTVRVRDEATFIARPNAALLRDWNEVQEAITDKVPLLDARNGQLFAAGHIPTARNFFLGNTLTGGEVKVWKGQEDLRSLAREAGVVPGQPVITYCTSGRESAQIWFTLRHVAGFGDTASYHGSLIDWRARGLPIARPE